MSLKLAIVGGGSTYTPELVDGFARLRDTLPVAELVLVDPAADRLELIGGLARRLFARQGHGATVTTTTDVTAGVAGADAVLLQLRVGGQAARNEDETWPLECGCVGQETTGAGGLAKALRTVPVVLDIAEQVRRTNPDAWIVDFTNPVGIVTRALQNAGHKAVGLCNVAIGFQRKFAAHLGVAPELIRLDHVGLNHLTWERGVTLLDAPGATTGREVLPELLDGFGESIAEDLRLPLPVIRRLGVVPSYYLRYFYQHDAVVEELRVKGSRAAEVAEIERQLLRMYADPALDTKPELLGRRGGAFYSEAAVQLIGALLGTGGGTDVQVVNTRNDGVLPFLPDDAVIEVPAEVDAQGVRPLPQRPVEPLYAGLIASVTAYEQLALEAALKGGRHRVFDALLAHPLVGQLDLADRLTDRLLAHNRTHLSWA
ncbi:6-phospho-beta-glucosidase [Saccharothrix sp. ST-888]|uniref:6-phospho-beta-glucosidase n=1 Tax=Saccharothrix sp. ST-888 TaxID=1427391 RepID=UPI0005EC17D2|nr:6-phospho-beta-glucosidase [Saccharothrix sp. ST-888]KJK56970.1 6-phospho-beta-glucosidase [Saccharothrix sp. ST-888]